MSGTVPRPAGLRPARRAALLVAALVAMPSTVAAQSLAPLLRGYVTATSDFRDRGLSESRGQPSLQIGGDLQHRSGFFAGAWAAQIEALPYPGSETADRFKAGYYVGYTQRVARWSVTATAAHYAYPGIAVDYDYSELSGGIAYRDRIFFSASYTDDLFSSGASGWYSEFGIVLPLPYAFELGATVGRLDSSGLGLDYSHWNAGVSKSLGRRIGLDVRRYDVSRYYSNAVATTNGDAWVVSASYAFGGRFR
jgi:uncharacterized protein (TIGR02001 family)